MLRPAFRLSSSVFAVGLAIAVSSFTVAHAEHAKPDKKSKTCDSANPCITYSNTGAGNAIKGIAVNQSALYGVSNQAGLYAQTNDSTGAYYALHAAAGATSAGMLQGTSTSGGFITVDPSGNVSISGVLTQMATARTVQRTRFGQSVLTYGAQSTAATLEDTGSARMAAGVANVVLDHAFAAALDATSAYRVFLTPLADTRGLYVSAKSPAGFQVRETQGGHGTLWFDYRIVATPLGARAERLPAAPSLKQPR